MEVRRIDASDDIDLLVEQSESDGSASLTMPLPLVSVSTDATNAGSAVLQVESLNAQALEAEREEAYELVEALQRLNNARYLNKFLEAVNGRLVEGGTFVGQFETAAQRRANIYEKYGWLLGPLLYAADFVLQRIGPKLKITRRLYFAITRGRNRVLTTPEVLGRLASCGFEIVGHELVDGRTRVTARKVGRPAFDMSPSYGPFFTMRRVGQGGKTVYVYKLRTMHPYAEYLQGYVHATQNLDSTGKFKDDFRITPWGKVLRKLWIDELPMLINWVRRDLKLVGVRPLSEHYLSLYPEDVRERRLKHRPGLVPPYYADMPDGFDEVVRSEKAYLEAYEQRPFVTDVQYFCKAFYNIALKGARSG